MKKKKRKGRVKQEILLMHKSVEEERIFLIFFFMTRSNFHMDKLIVYQKHILFTVSTVYRSANKKNNSF